MSRMRQSAKAIGYAISGVIAAGLLSSCASSGHLAHAGKEPAIPSSGKLGHAVETAEAAVAQSPSDAAARVALGQTYLEAGRFQSAVTTFDDAVKLGDSSGRTQLSLALAEIAAGYGPAAVTVLDNARDAIPATDRGLALALAGESSRGVAILSDALRGGENTPKMRQNLAYAYALDGRWREARLMMGQDVPANLIDDRISDWAMMAQPEDVQKRVAALLGAPVGAKDPGQPERLALAGAPQGQRLAAAEPQPAPAELPALDQSVVAAAPAPVPVELASAPPAAPVPVAAPAAPTFNAAFADAPPAPAARPVARPVAPARARHNAPATRVAAAAPQPVANGNHLLQLGSFTSEALARGSWRAFTSRNPELRSYRMTITPAVVNGKNYWRVAAGGLDAGSAQRVCSAVKNRGGNCFAYAGNNAPAGAKQELALAGTGSVKARRR